MGKVAFDNVGPISSKKQVNARNQTMFRDVGQTRAGYSKVL